MAFFTKAEIIQRLKEQRAEMGPDVARADLGLAMIIATSVHFGQFLKSGRDYIEHPLFVATHNTKSIAKIIIGFLHDVIEDSKGEWTVDDLREIGFSERIVSGVDAMTKRPSELYFDFIERCSFNADGRDKKIDDLSHNLDESRTDRLINDTDKERMNKYKISKAYLIAVKKCRIESGSSIIDFVNSNDNYKNHLSTPFLIANYSGRSKPEHPIANAVPAPPQLSL